MLVAIAILWSMQAAPADVDPLVKRLGSEEPKVREEADRKLREIARRDPAGTRTQLKRKLEDEKDFEIQSRLRAILRGDLALELVLKVEPGKVGQGAVLVAKLRNTSDIEQVMVRAIDGSHDLRSPGCRVEAAGPDGKAVPPPRIMRDCKFMNPLKREDFVTLKPGEEAVFSGADGGWISPFFYHWKPDRPGTYQLTFTCDYSSTDIQDWLGSRVAAIDKDVDVLFTRVPKVTLKATIPFEVAK